MEKNLYSKGNKNFFLDYFKFFEPENLKLVNHFERMETEEETKIRIDKEENILYENWRIKCEKEEQERLANPKAKKAKNPIEPQKPIFDFVKDPIIVNEPIISNIDMSEGYCEFSKWVGSVFQSIKDLDVNDVNDVRIL